MIAPEDWSDRYYDTLCDVAELVAAVLPAPGRVFPEKIDAAKWLIAASDGWTSEPLLFDPDRALRQFEELRRHLRASSDILNEFDSIAVQEVSTHIVLDIRNAWRELAAAENQIKDRLRAGAPPGRRSRAAVATFAACREVWSDRSGTPAPRSVQARAFGDFVRAIFEMLGPLGFRADAEHAARSWRALYGELATK